MVNLNQLYPILEEMLESAIKMDTDKTIELHRAYEALIPNGYLSPTQLELEYENCRQSCVMSVTMVCHQKIFINDAKERFSKLKKPEVAL